MAFLEPSAFGRIEKLILVSEEQLMNDIVGIHPAHTHSRMGNLCGELWLHRAEVIHVLCCSYPTELDVTARNHTRNHTGCDLSEIHLCHWASRAVSVVE